MVPPWRPVAPVTRTRMRVGWPNSKLSVMSGNVDPPIALHEVLQVLSSSCFPRPCRRQRGTLCRIRLMPQPVDWTAFRKEQRALASQVRVEDDLSPVRLVGGFDVAYAGEHAFGAVVVLDATTAEPVEVVHSRVATPCPYVPGFLAAREFPALEAAWQGLTRHPDVLVVDGAGLMHPLRIGSAGWAGVKLDVPTVGVTKNPFVGELEGDTPEVGDAAPVHDGGTLLGYALRTRPPPVKPIYVSPGHRITPDTALALVRSLLCGRKLPEPTRLAHEEAARAKRAFMEL